MIKVGQLYRSRRKKKLIVVEAASPITIRVIGHKRAGMLTDSFGDLISPKDFLERFSLVGNNYKERS